MQDQGSWGNCPLGVLTDMAVRLRRRRRQAQRRPVIAIAVAMLLVSAVGYALLGRNNSATRAELTCREAIPLLAKYHDQTLDAATAKDVQEHLSRCPSCRKHYEQSFPSEVRNPSSAKQRLVALATEP